MGNRIPTNNTLDCSTSFHQKRPPFRPSLATLRPASRHFHLALTLKFHRLRSDLHVKSESYSPGETPALASLPGDVVSSSTMAVPTLSGALVGYATVLRFMLEDKPL